MRLRRFNVFFAVPFDAPTKSMYDTIIEDLRTSRFKDDFHFSLGTTSVGQPQPDFSKMSQLKLEEFKAQNQDFFTRFLHVIESNDIIIADLTNNNPSVHIELGIALTLNKNIMRVSGRDLVDVATDIRGYEVNKYTCRQQLYDWIAGYLDYFLTIKQQPPLLTIRDWQTIGLPTTERAALQSAPFGSTLITDEMRDGEIRLSFRFKATYEDEDWFGISLRTVDANPWLGAYLVFARRNGELVMRSLPGSELFVSETHKPLAMDEEHRLHINIDGSHLFASLDEELDQGLNTDRLTNQSPGSVAISCYRTWAEFRMVELVNHDTIAFR